MQTVPAILSTYPVRFGYLNRKQVDQFMENQVPAYLDQTALLDLLETLPHQDYETTPYKVEAIRKKWNTFLENYLTTFTQRKKKILALKESTNTDILELAQTLARIMISRIYTPSKEAFQALMKEFQTLHSSVADPPVLTK